MTPKDVQRSKVIACIDSVGLKHNLFLNKFNLTYVQGFVNAYNRSMTWHMSHNVHYFSVRLGKNNSLFSKPVNITKTMWSFQLDESNINILHIIRLMVHSQLAHNVSFHGPEFVEFYLNTVQSFLGEVIRNDVQDAFEKAGVRFTPSLTESNRQKKEMQDLLQRKAVAQLNYIMKKLGEIGNA